VADHLNEFQLLIMDHERTRKMKRNIRIIVITRPNCIACRMLRYELKKRDIEYEAVTSERAEEVFNMKFTGAPITLIIDHDIHPYQLTRFNGYGKITLERILKQIGYEKATTKSTKEHEKNEPLENIDSHIPGCAGGINA